MKRVQNLFWVLLACFVSIDSKDGENLLSQRELSKQEKSKKKVQFIQISTILSSRIRQSEDDYHPSALITAYFPS